jgi:hypothetical protein
VQLPGQVEILGVSLTQANGFSGPVEVSTVSDVRTKKGKDAMRHIPVIVCALGLMSAALGCDCLHHEAGICDCKNDIRGCERYSPITPTSTMAPPATASTPAPTVTPVPEAPKPLPIIPR